MSRLDIYWSFRSPYSYLAVDRLIEIEQKFDLDTHFRPVRPLAMREPDFFERGRKQFLPYLFRDVPREAERLGVPFALPNPDPIDMDMESGKVAPDQPKLNMILALGLAAADAGSGLIFAAAAARRIWSGADWTTEEALSSAAAEAGLELADLRKWVAGNNAEIQKTIEANEAAQLEYHWGVPLMVLDGEPFFGQDRIDALQWRLEQQH
ncbi:MAG: DsbA family protein [Pseudomonadota bacterium]